MADDDSRTATLGRKRQRDLQDDQTNAGLPSPDKKVKLAAGHDEEDDDDESDYSPSPDLPQLEPSREPPASPSQHDPGFPHMSGAAEPAAKADELSAAQEQADTGKPELQSAEGDDFIALPADDDDFATGNEKSSHGSAAEGGGEREESRPELAQNASSQSTPKAPGRITLTKKQTSSIRTFEEERALRIMRTGIGGFWTAKKGFHSQDAVGAIISMSIPKVPVKNDPKKMANGISKDTIHTRVITAIGSNCPIGLLGIYRDQKQDSPDFHDLVVVRTQEHFETLKKFFADTPLEFALKGSNQNGDSKDFYFLTVQPAADNKKLQFGDNRKLSAKKGVTSVLAQALTHYVKQRLESGEMSPADYEGFNPTESKKVLQKAAKQDIGAGVVKADPQYAWDHLTAKSHPQSQSDPKDQPSKPTSAASTEPSTPASEAQDTNFSSDEEGEISSEPASNAPQPESPHDAAESGESAAGASSSGPVRAHVTQLSESEMLLQVRYFGEPKDGLARCLTCARRGHMRESCPSRTCGHCRAVDRHFTNSCPTVAKCAKCRERGHSKESCPSKLARSSADGFSCDLCGEKGHPEEDCALRWCSFNPKQLAELVKVERMTVSCYQCGSQQHWGDDCPMRPRRATHASNIFSAKEANKYLVDPRAAAEELRRNGPAGQGMSIRGRAQGQGQHTYFSSSDNDDDDDDGDIDNFYRSRRGAGGSSNNNNIGPGTAPRGNIRINAGAGFRGGRFSQKNTREPNGGGNQFEPISSGWQPPLPNEPPPPLPPLPPSRGGGGRGGRGGRGGGGRGASGGAGVNHMPLPPRPQPPPGPPRKPWRGRGGRK